MTAPTDKAPLCRDCVHVRVVAGEVYDFCASAGLPKWLDPGAEMPTTDGARFFLEACGPTGRLFKAREGA